MEDVFSIHTGHPDRPVPAPIVRPQKFKSSSLHLHLACLHSLRYGFSFQNHNCRHPKKYFSKTFKKVGYQSGVMSVLTIPIHPRPIGEVLFLTQSECSNVLTICRQMFHVNQLISSPLLPFVCEYSPNCLTPDTMAQLAASPTPVSSFRLTLNQSPIT